MINFDPHQRIRGPNSKNIPQCKLYTSFLYPLQSIQYRITILQSKLQKYYNKYNKGNHNKANNETH